MPDPKPEPNRIYAMAMPIDFLARCAQLALERGCIEAEVVLAYALAGWLAERIQERKDK